MRESKDVDDWEGPCVKPWGKISEFVVQTSLEKLPAAVIDQAKLVLMDTLGAMLAGSRVDPIPNLVLRSKKGAATIAGHSALADPFWAALVNGISAVALEMDEGNQFAKGHPAAHVVPAALAWAEQEGASGRQVLESLVVGYEVAARVGAGTSLRPEVHPHGTWGTIGAAVAVAKLRGFSASQVHQAIQVGGLLSLATAWKTALEGASVRNIYTGLSNHLGLLSTEFVLAGFQGSEASLETVFGQVISTGFCADTLTRDLGNIYQINNNYFKLYSCCRYNHAALDALEEILAAHPVTFEQVDAVKVETYDLAAQLADQQPGNVLAAKFSIPFALAAYLVRGNAGLHSFTDETLGDIRIRELARRVFVRENPEMTAMLPEKRPARVILCLQDGRQLTHTVFSSHGGFDRPYPLETLREKFRQLAGEAIGGEATEKLITVCQQIEGLEDIRGLTVLLRP